MRKNCLIKILFLILVNVFFADIVYGQLNPLGAAYYRNQYLANPAMAGIDANFKASISYRKLWNGFVGSPETQSLTGEYRFKKVGMGLNLYNDKAGLQTITRTTVTYAYHLLVNNNDQFHFGLSLGFANVRLNTENLHGDPNDLSVARYNQRAAYLDGDFGLAYAHGRLLLQGAIPNLKSFLGMDNQVNAVDKSSLFISAGYKLDLESTEDGITIEPKVSLRSIKGSNNILDIGVNTNVLNNQLQLFGVYHSSQSATYGFGFKFGKMNISGMYTSETSAIKHYTDGNFEVGLQFQY